MNQFSRKVIQKMYIITLLLKCLANDLLSDEILTIKKKIKQEVSTVRIISKTCLKIVIIILQTKISHKL